MIIDWRKISKEIYEEIKSHIETSGTKYSLKVVLVGNNQDSLRYVGQKEKWANYVWMNYELVHLEESTTEEELLSIVKKLNKDENTDGFIVQLPLPKHINDDKVIEAIDCKKDIDGFTKDNMWKIVLGENSALAPCTPTWVMELIKKYDIELSGKNAVVIGRSNIVGKPMANMLVNAGATVTVCNSRTKDIKYYTKNADLVIIAIGKPNFLTLDMINDRTAIIDVWFTVVDGKIYGDANFEEIDANGNAITPVPGWVGPMTVACLMKNVIRAKDAK